VKGIGVAQDCSRRQLKDPAASRLALHSLFGGVCARINARLVHSIEMSENLNRLAILAIPGFA
jgi:hypothetical protein